MSARVALGFVFLAAILAAATRADTLDDIRSRGTLIWGGDQEGGGPYIYPDPDQPSQVIGFEVDLARALAPSSESKPNSLAACGTTYPIC